MDGIFRYADTVAGCHSTKYGKLFVLLIFEVQEAAPRFASQQDDQFRIRVFIQNIGERFFPLPGLIEVGSIHVFYDGGILSAQQTVRFFNCVDIFLSIFGIRIVGRDKKYLLLRFFRSSRIAEEGEQK